MIPHAVASRISSRDLYCRNILRRKGRYDFPVIRKQSTQIFWYSFRGASVSYDIIGFRIQVSVHVLLVSVNVVKKTHDRVLVISGLRPRVICVDH